MSEIKERYEAFKKIGDDHFDGLHNAITDYVFELEQKNKQLEQEKSELIEDRTNLMNLFTECIELDYFKDEAVLILHELITKQSIK